MVWIRISVHDGLAPNVLPMPSAVVYLIWFTNSEYLLTASIKKEWVEFIMEVKTKLSNSMTGKKNTQDIRCWTPQCTNNHLLTRIYLVSPYFPDRPLCGCSERRKLRSGH